MMKPEYLSCVGISARHSVQIGVFACENRFIGPTVPQPKRDDLRVE